MELNGVEWHHHYLTVLALRYLRYSTSFLTKLTHGTSPRVGADWENGAGIKAGPPRILGAQF